MTFRTQPFGKLETAHMCRFKITLKWSRLLLRLHLDFTNKMKQLSFIFNLNTTLGVFTSSASSVTIAIGYKNQAPHPIPTPKGCADLANLLGCEKGEMV